MGFFEKFKKERDIQPSQNIPERPRPIVSEIDVDGALPPRMEGEQPPQEVKEDYDVYEDEEDSNSASNQEEDIGDDNTNDDNFDESEASEDNDDSDNNSADNSDDNADDELVILEKQNKLMQEKIKKVRQQKEEERKRKLLEKRNLQSTTPSNYIQVPIYLSESEYLREIMRKLDNLELWAKQITTFLNRGGR